MQWTNRHARPKSPGAARVVAVLLLVLVGAGGVRGERIKDIVDVQGVRGNPLTGIGLVTGLSGTGDSSLLARQMLTNVLRDSGLVLAPSDLNGGSVAVVVVTAELGPFDREGMRIDIDISTLGDTKTLQGGMLLPTPLKGLDGQVYAVAQGGISLGGWSAGGKQAALSKNHQTVGRIASGAIVEKSELASFIEQIAGQRFVTLNLRNADFATAQRIGEAINESYDGSALTVDATSIKVMVPSEISQRDMVAFLDEIMQKEVVVDMPAMVVINERNRHDRGRSERGHLHRGDLAGQPGRESEGNRSGFATDGAFLGSRVHGSGSGNPVGCGRAERLSHPGGARGDCFGTGENTECHWGLAPRPDCDLQRVEEGRCVAGRSS